MGVDTERYYPVSDEEKEKIREKLQLPKDKKIILCVGELLPNKNQKMLIKAMKNVIEEFSDVLLLVAGNGPEKDSLVSLIEDCQMQDNIKLLGYCTNLEEYQRAIDISVSCSIREGLGLNLIEAMLTGNPVVATKNRGHNELVKDGYNGFLIEQYDVDSLSCKLLTLLKDDILCHDMGYEGINIGNRYNYRVVKEELKNIYFE